VIGWLDAQAGASGDMWLGAVVDAGVPIEVLQGVLDRLELGIRLEQRTVERGGIGARKVDVHGADDAHHRRLPDVYDLLQRLEDPVRETARQVFRRLAEAEGAVHRIDPEQVTFHEVGALDAIADVVATVAGVHHLGLTRLHCSTVSLGSGTTRGAHGPLPVPAPAVLRLLAGAPVSAGPSRSESTTPTGAALLATLVTDWGPLPTMVVEQVGYGAGTRDPDEVANVLRLAIGHPVSDVLPVGQTRPVGEVRPEPSALLLETNVDDLDPRLWPHIIARLLEAGASDAWLSPILMKKGRPAHTLSVLCRPDVGSVVRAVVFRETSTIGLRESPVGKYALQRTESVVEIEGQQIRIKHAWLDGSQSRDPVNSNPEWDDVARAAIALGRPAKEILARARALAFPPSSFS